jgi:SRSO17 transposase
MDIQDLSLVRETFEAFHAHFAPAFGRKQWRKRSRDYLQALLVQNQERCNAENLSEVVDASPRVLQRFLTEAAWDHDTVTETLQKYLPPRLTHPQAVWAVDESGVVKQGKKSAGVARQYCGAVGKVANCQMGVYLAYLSPRGRALVDKRLYLPQEWTKDAQRCEEAGVPEQARPYQSKAELALGLLKRAVGLGHLQAPWVTGDDEYGKSPEFRDGVASLGLWYMLEVPGNTPVWPLLTLWFTPEAPKRGRPPQPRPEPSQRQEVRERAAALPSGAWQAITVAEGAQGPRTYWFAFERRRESRDQEPGDPLGVVYRKNLDGSEARYYFTNAPQDTPADTQAFVAAARWPIETEFEVSKSQVGLDEYEVRSWQGWNHHITLCLLASAFLLGLQQDWGEKAAPDHAPTGLSGGVRALTAQALDGCGFARVA